LKTASELSVTAFARSTDFSPGASPAGWHKIWQEKIQQILYQPAECVKLRNGLNEEGRLKS
jgi:hypothetical protein